MVKTGPVNTNKIAVVITTANKLSVDQLEALGYRITGDKHQIRTSIGKFVVYEVSNEDNKRDVDFCYFYEGSSKMGVILPHSYEYYLRNPLV